MRIAVLIALVVSQAPLAFDVASIKPNTSGETRQGVRFYPPSDRVVVTNLTLRGLIRNAYQLQDDEVAGGPSWLDSDHFDIVASSDGNHSPQDKWLMMRALLVERFMLAVHKETRELPVYALVPALLRRRDRRIAIAPTSAAPCMPGRGPSTSAASS
jgi:uncharacterized protein (TIGR03435 family)